MSQPKRLAFQKFLNAMRKLSVEVNDNEICKRLEILMATSKDDLPIATVNQLLLDPKNFDPKLIPEPYTQYVRHFIYMVKRNGRLPADLSSGLESGSSLSNETVGKSKQTRKPASKSKSKTANPSPKTRVSSAKKSQQKR
ncbi:MAG: hypothetical protein MUF77_04695 [Leptospira sp.]|nr:hypothetical protein [Leptospira sp.]